MFRHSMVYYKLSWYGYYVIWEMYRYILKSMFILIYTSTYFEIEFVICTMCISVQHVKAKRQWQLLLNRMHNDLSRGCIYLCLSPGPGRSVSQQTQKHFNILHPCNNFLGWFYVSRMSPYSIFRRFSIEVTWWFPKCSETGPAKHFVWRFLIVIWYYMQAQLFARQHRR